MNLYRPQQMSYFANCVRKLLSMTSVFMLINTQMVACTKLNWQFQLPAGNRLYRPQTFQTLTERLLKRLWAPIFLSRSYVTLFFDMVHPLPSESTSRRIVENVAKEEENQMIYNFTNKDIFIVIDEAEVDGKKYLNILGGHVENPLSRDGERGLMLQCIILLKNCHKSERSSRNSLKMAKLSPK